MFEDGEMECDMGHEICECNGVTLLGVQGEYCLSDGEFCVRLPKGLIKLVGLLPGNSAIAVEHSAEIQAVCNALAGVATSADVPVLAQLASASW